MTAAKDWEESARVKGEAPLGETPPKTLRASLKVNESWAEFIRVEGEVTRALLAKISPEALSMATEVAESLRFASSLMTRRKKRLLTCAFSRQVWGLLDRKLQEIVEELDEYAEAYPEKWLLRGDRPQHPRRQRLLELHKEADEVYLDWVLQSNNTSSRTRAARTIVGATLQEEYYAVLDAQQYALMARGYRPGVIAKQREMIQDVQPFELVRRRAVPIKEPPLDRSWLTGTVVGLAATAYRERSLPSAELESVRLLILADALEDAGCERVTLLSHLRSPTVHVRGCWALDCLLKEAEGKGQ